MDEFFLSAEYYATSLSVAWKGSSNGHEGKHRGSRRYHSRSAQFGIFISGQLFYRQQGMPTRAYLWQFTSASKILRSF